MKKLFLLSLIIVLSGCYLANGSPSETNFWIKNGKKISSDERLLCYEKTENLILSKEDKISFYRLQSKYLQDRVNMITNHKKEYDQYIFLLNKISILSSKCFYDLGYRFQAPLYWCLAQDGDNTKICIENMKYRN